MTHTTTDAAEARAPGHDEVPTLEQATRWLGKFSNQDEVASTTPRKIAFELAGIHSLLLSLATAEAASGAGEREAVAEKVATLRKEMATGKRREWHPVHHDWLTAILDAASLPPATDPAMVEQRRKPDYEPAWREMYDALSWMHGCKPLAGYAGWPLGKIATDLIDQAYPSLREGTAPTAEGLVPKMREAICGAADDYQTSEQHHPGHVLIPLAKFEQLRAVAEEVEATHD